MGSGRSSGGDPEFPSGWACRKCAAVDAQAQEIVEEIVGGMDDLGDAAGAGRTGTATGQTAAAAAAAVAAAGGTSVGTAAPGMAEDHVMGALAAAGVVPKPVRRRGLVKTSEALETVRADLKNTKRRLTRALGKIAAFSVIMGSGQRSAAVLWLSAAASQVATVLLARFFQYFLRTLSDNRCEQQVTWHPHVAHRQPTLRDNIL